MLFEMLAGKRAFEGDDVADTLAHILTKEPDWSALPAHMPAAILRLLRRCLDRDCKRRLDSAAAARLEIDDASGASVENGTPQEPHLVYQEGTGTSSQLVVRAIDQLEPVPLHGTTGSRWPFVSPDSQWIGFYVEDGSGGGILKKVSMTGGTPVTVCRVHGTLTGAG